MPQSATPPVRLVIADDHALFRQGLRKLLENQADLRIVGEFADGQGICELAEATQPDLLLLDLDMPKVSGFDVLRQLRVANCMIDTIVLTASENRAELGAALELGAKGIVLKRAVCDELLEAIRHVRRGFPWFDRAIGGLEVRHAPRFAATPEEDRHFPAAPERARKDLTAREAEIAFLIGQKLRYSDIAQRLAITPSTLNYHLRSILGKLRAASPATIAPRQDW